MTFLYPRTDRFMNNGDISSVPVNSQIRLLRFFRHRLCKFNLLIELNYAELFSNEVACNVCDNLYVLFFPASVGSGLFRVICTLPPTALRNLDIIASHVYLFFRVRVL